jgi:protein-disulfide isomerase
VAVILVGGIVALSVFKKSEGDPNTISSAQVGLFDKNHLIDSSSIPSGFTNTGATPATTASNTYDNHDGAKDAKVTFIEYGDLSCSHCALYNDIIETARKKYDSKVVFIFRYYVLGNQGQNGLAAATAVEAAARQGKFWDMKDTMYKNQDAWFYSSATDRKGLFEQYAKNVGVKDMTKWSNDYDNYLTNGINTKISFDHALGDEIPVEGTPTLVINGHKLDPDNDKSDTWTTQDELNGQIEKYMKKAGVSI